MKLAPHPALLPLSLLYRLGVGIRNRGYDRGSFAIKASTLPIICVGNVIAGGSGKTPFVQILANELKQLDRSPAILLRGYGGSTAGPHLVTADDTAAAVGDEAILHYQKLRDVPIVVARNRHAGAKLIEAEQLAATIVMDDGYQHRSLARGVNLLLLDISDEESISRWGRGRLLPAGWLREPLAVALKRANGVVLVDKGAANNAESRLAMARKLLPPNIVPIRIQLRPHLLRDVLTGAIQPFDHYTDRSVVAATAIAHPGSFFSLLESIGYSKLTTHRFPDHYQFSAQDVARFLSSGAPVMVTEKDETKLRPLVRQPGKVFSLVLRGCFSDDASRAELLSILR